MTNYISWPSFFGIALIIRNQVLKLLFTTNFFNLGIRSYSMGGTILHPFQTTPLQLFEAESVCRGIDYGSSHNTYQITAFDMSH
jgi:hypothetical protein